VNAGEPAKQKRFKVAHQNAIKGKPTLKPHDSTLPQGSPASAKSGAGPAIVVWLIEDNHTYRQTIARVLNQVPDIDCAQDFSNAEDALHALLDGAVADVMLVDVELPGLNGIETVRRIKTISPATRIIMLTVFDDHEKIFRAVCAGASGYLLKTATVDKIIESIRDVCAGGASMTPGVAQSVLEMFSHLIAPPQDFGLTVRERSILELMTEGLLKKEIADRLALSYHTVDTHLRNIYAKLHVHTRSGAVAKALQGRMFPPPRR
jgi:DNA-binding NarL/FixJ family response regulator